MRWSIKRMSQSGELDLDDLSMPDIPKIEEGLIAPVANEVLMHFNMDNTVYFATLDQYKYNLAVIYKAEVGNQLVSCAEGIVVDMYQNEELVQSGFVS